MFGPGSSVIVKKVKKKEAKKREEDRRKIINMNSFDDTIELNYLSY
jgi:hypothetical protein